MHFDAGFQTNNPAIMVIEPMKESGMIFRVAAFARNGRETTRLVHDEFIKPMEDAFESECPKTDDKRPKDAEDTQQDGDQG